MTVVLKSLGLACVLILAGCSGSSATINKDAIKSEITDMLHAQDAAWNAGDIDGFMEDYLKSEDLRFASGGNVNRGWQATIDGYKNRYPDKETMGKLTFKDMEIKVLSAQYAQVFGRWELEREQDKPGGLFTLLVQKRDEKWLIITDHTSSD